MVFTKHDNVAGSTRPKAVGRFKAKNIRKRKASKACRISAEQSEFELAAKLRPQSFVFEDRIGREHANALARFEGMPRIIFDQSRKIRLQPIESREERGYRCGPRTPDENSIRP
jgi:hypothetical protein